MAVPIFEKITNWMGFNSFSFISAKYFIFLKSKPNHFAKIPCIRKPSILHFN